MSTDPTAATSEKRKPRKAMYLLPNGCTLASVAFGFYALTVAAAATTPADFGHAALFVFFAIVCDMLDGRVARMTRTQSEFGVELDSLADVISFGVVPAFIVYRWGLEPLGWLGIVGAFTFVACSAMRLARFNVLAHNNVPDSKYFFTGLPTPMSAGMMMSVVLLHGQVGDETVQAPLNVLILTFAIAYLMVSNVRYFTFKDKSKRTRLLMFVAAATFFTLGFNFGFAFAFAFCGGLYIASGLLGEFVFFGRAVRQKRAESAAFESADESAEDEAGQSDSPAREGRAI